MLEVPTALYHYTDGQGLPGILQSGCIRLTDIFELNDPSELRHGVLYGCQTLIQHAEANGDARLHEVAAAVESALADPTPQLRYLLVPSADQAEVTIKAQIEQLVQLNEGQRHAYDRATLIKMLDAALKSARHRGEAHQGE